MSSMKNGFSTLNRWLGKKNKEKSAAPNGKLSKSSTNLSLSISTTNIDDTSQLEYNRIAPLPAVTSNAPFEQTFRITVLLPKDQLYVQRLGARVPLSKLLELVCDHKSLDPEKYEFRNPVDPSQIYNCDLTIGAVGLSEIRLCHKSDSYESYHTDDITTKLSRTSAVRGSLSSSEFSSRSNSKHTTKTASPYSSNNSLNSMDSTGINYTHNTAPPPLPALPKSMPPKVAAPPRKKRAAPRPPSQTVIPEKAPLVIENEAQDTEHTIHLLKQQQEAMNMPTRKEYYSSTPNLSSNITDCNGNNNNRNSTINPISSTATNGNLSEDTEVIYAQVAQKNARNLHSGSIQNLTSDSSKEHSSKFPEPSPRKRLLNIKKKTAPAPPPRNSTSFDNDDSLSIASTTASTPDTPGTAESEKELYMQNASNLYQSSKDNLEAPVPVVREKNEPLKSSTPVLETKSIERTTIINEVEKIETPPPNIPKPVPRQTTTTLLNATTMETNCLRSEPSTQYNTNVSKVLLNRTPTPEPRSLSSDIEEHLPMASEDDDNISKQADSGIGETIPSPIPDSLQSESSAHECKSTFESSSDDDDMVKIYNFKLGRTIIKSNGQEQQPTKTLVDLKTLQLDSGETTPAVSTQEHTPNVGETTSWNFAIPISPPPNFADKNAAATITTEQTSTDSPITPKIVERPILNFDNLSTTMEMPKDVVDHKSLNEEKPIINCPSTPLPSPSSPINEIIDELSTILNENRISTLIRKQSDEQPEIESAKPNTLTNFTITSLSVQQATFNEPTSRITTASTPDDEEKLYKKRSSITTNNNGIGLKQRKSVTRADSFHTTSTVNGMPGQNSTISGDSTISGGLNSRSASYLSLTKLEQNGMLNSRRSSSELSIGESPSLQSLEVIKTILNSRKNSLANSSDGETKTNDTVNIKEQRSIVESKVVNVEIKPKQQKIEKDENPIKNSNNTNEESSNDKSKALPKVYRYSGPPSINFSTWSERPKIQVAIKNEGDYIFGGKNANNQNAAVTQANIEIRRDSNQRVSMPAAAINEITKMPPPVAPKPIALASPTERMGIPEKDFHVPIIVKPLKDVTVEKIVKSEQKPPTEQSVTKVNINQKQDTPKTNTLTKVNKNQEEESSNTNSLVRNQLKQVPVSNTSTLPRVGNLTNRFSIPANIPTTPGPNLLRSTSITQLDSNQKKSVIESETTVTTAPFGQNTLRRTGFKEKILAKEEQAQKQQTNVTISTPSKSGTTTIHMNGTTNSTNIKNKSILNNSTKALQTAKLELKLQDTNQVTVNQTQQNSNKTPITPRVTTPKSAPPAPTPPAPPMPILKSVTLRSQSVNNKTTTPTNGDPRDALLEAIRSFKRAELNKV